MRRAFVISLFSFACGSEIETPMPMPMPMPMEMEMDPVGLPVLGSWTHDLTKIAMATMSKETDQLSMPRDLAFNPQAPRELWVVNRADESVVLYYDIGDATQNAWRYWSPSSAHFLAQPSALAFGAPGTFATIHETDQLTQGDFTPEDFMGPTLWTSDIGSFDAGDGGHLDMLHNSPNGMGIAWERDNVYWVFDGYHSSLTRYDFAADHGLAGTDHTDGIIARYVEPEVSRVADVPSHLVFDARSGRLFVADTGNNRIAALDTGSGDRGGTIGPNYDGAEMYRMMDATLATLVDGAAVGLVQPSGIALHDDVLYVTDHQTSRIWGFSTEGEVLDWLDTGLPAKSLMGIEVSDRGFLFLVDAVENRIIRISPR